MPVRCILWQLPWWLSGGIGHTEKQYQNCISISWKIAQCARHRLQQIVFILAFNTNRAILTNAIPLLLISLLHYHDVLAQYLLLVNLTSWPRMSKTSSFQVLKKARLQISISMNLTAIWWSLQLACSIISQTRCVEASETTTAFCVIGCLAHIYSQDTILTVCLPALWALVFWIFRKFPTTLLMICLACSSQHRSDYCSSPSTRCIHRCVQLFWSRTSQHRVWVHLRIPVVCIKLDHIPSWLTMYHWCIYSHGS